MSDSTVTRTGSNGPVLSFQQVADELGVHKTTLYRSILPFLEVVEITEKRRGVTRAVLDNYKRKRTTPPSRAA
jgi:hypothetical protein